MNDPSAPIPPSPDPQGRTPALPAWRVGIPLAVGANPPSSPTTPPASAPASAPSSPSPTTTPNVLDTLAQDARVIRSARMLPTDREPTKEQITAAISAIEEWRIAQGVSYASIRSQLGDEYSESTISQVLNRKYKGDSRSVINAILSLVERSLRHAEATEGHTAEVVKTTVVSRAMQVIKQCDSQRTMGAVIGQAGLGKTVIARAAQQMTSGSVLVRIDEFSCNRSGFLLELGRKVDVNIRSFNFAWHAIRGRLGGTGRLLLIDEAHRLKPPALSLVRDLHDCCGIPIVLFGTSALNGNVSDQADGSQFYSRLQIVYSIDDDIAAFNSGDGQPVFTVEDIIRICGAGKLALTKDAGELLMTIAHTPAVGSIRTCQRLLWTIASISKLRNQPIDAQVLRSTLRQLKGDTHSRVFESRTSAAAPAVTRTRRVG